MDSVTLLIQRELASRGLYKAALDGIVGPLTIEAMWAAIKPIPNGKFDQRSAQRLSQSHPLLQKLMNAAREKTVFSVLESQRGRAAQERAYREGRSKAHFGQSAHNWTPAIALDIVPTKTTSDVDWDDLPAFKAMGKIVGCFNPQTGAGYGLAKEMKIPARWLGDPNFDNNFVDGWDFPHFELHKWRDFAKDCQPYEG